jgi:hypothetical protein
MRQKTLSTFGQTDPPALGQKDSRPLDRLAGTLCRRRAPRLVSHADIPGANSFTFFCAYEKEQKLFNSLTERHQYMCPYCNILLTRYFHEFPMSHAMAT